MAFIALASTSGAPGVTAAAVALTVSWPKPAVLVEADTSKISSVIPGTLRGQVDLDHGLTEAAVADRYGALDLNVLNQQTVKLLDDTKFLIPGFKNLRGASGATSGFWRNLVDVLRLWEATGRDVFVDVGRLRVDDPRRALLTEADSITLMTDRTLPAIGSLSQHWQSRRANHPVAEWLKVALEEIGHGGYVDLVTVDRATSQETWPAAEVAELVGLKLLGTVPWDPRGAAAWALGSPILRTDRTPYSRAIAALRHGYGDVLRDRSYIQTLETQP